MTTMNEVKTTPLPRDEVIHMARAAGLTVGTNISGVMLVGSPSPPGIAHIDIDEMAAFAAIARADLEAENQRLREALVESESRLTLLINRDQHKLLDVAARDKVRTALKGSNHD